MTTSTTRPRIRSAGVEDVARLSNVSPTTVSRALSQPWMVKERTLRRVLEAVEKLGYVADGAARALKSRRSMTVGAVIPSLENAIFATTTDALQRVLDKSGYALLLATSWYDVDTEVALTRKMIERGVDALVLVGTQHRPETFGLLARFDLPYVLTWAFDSSGQLPCVGFDHRAATRKVASHLLELGHREFGIVCTPIRDNERARERLAGVIDRLGAAGITVPPERIVEQPFSYSAGKEAFRTLMRDPFRPTAVICLNDVLAIGAVSAAYEMDISVPQEVSITGCEDLEVAASVPPGLTTVRYPTSEMGVHAGQYLLARLQDLPVQAPVVFPTELIVRGTTAPPIGDRRETSRVPS